MAHGLSEVKGLSPARSEDAEKKAWQRAWHDLTSPSGPVGHFGEWVWLVHQSTPGHPAHEAENIRSING